MHFLPVEPEHLPTLAAILNHYIAHTTVSFHTEPVTEDEMAGKVFFAQPAFQAYTLVEDDAIIGYCSISPWKVQQAYRHTGEMNIYLAPEHCGKGLGTIAITHLVAHAKANDIYTLIAGLCSENEPSRRLFEKCGFVQCAHFRNVGRKFGRVLDTVYLQKELGQGPGA